MEVNIKCYQKQCSFDILFVPYTLVRISAKFSDSSMFDPVADSKIQNNNKLSVY